jgi:hypothetical protein
MKTNYFKMAFVSLFAVVALCSCSKDEDDNIDSDKSSKSAACEILLFNVNGEEWNISGTNITPPYPPAGTAEIILTPFIELSPGATVNPPSNTAQNFFVEQGVTYTVTAEDGKTKKTYIAKATVLTISKSTACEILSFSVNGEEWDINGTNITHLYPAGTAETSLTPVIKLSPRATVNPPSNTAQNFFTAQGVTYTVTAEDGKTKEVYTVRATVQTSGATGDCTWTLTGESGNYTLTISGNGAMADYNYWNNAAPWESFRNAIKTLVIQDGVTTVGEAAFTDCSGLTAVTISNSVTTIGRWAFVRCSSLTGVTIPNSVTIIGEEAFAGCSGLTSVTIPNSVTTIDGTFAGCISLLSVTIPNSVTTIGNSAFSTCRSLTAVTIPNSVATIGRYAFHDCRSLTSVTIPNSVTTIEEYAFSDCSKLTTVINLNTVPQHISGSVFEEYTKACTLKVPASAVEDYKAAPVWREFGNITAN